jgi:hypothetical protein
VYEAQQVSRRHGHLSPQTIATGLGVLVLALLSLTAVLSTLIHQATFLNIATGIPIPLVYAAVGVIVARHQPRNPVGWLLIGFVLLFLIPVDAGYYATLLYHFGHHGLPFGRAALVLVSLWPLAFALFPLVILLFPDGRLTSPRWRWVLRGYAVAVAYVVAVNLIPAVAAKVGHDIQVNSIGDVNYTYHLAPALAALNAVAYASIGVMWLSFVGHQVLSWRRAAGERRQQLKWLACGAAITLCLGLLGSALASASDASRLMEVGVTAMPIAIGVGILKYRLYDIDRIISRTLAYAIVTGLLVGVYAGLVLLSTQVLTITSPVAVAVSTLVAAALFSPLRRRVQHTVDRRFNRARYDADQTIAAFAVRLKDAVDLDTVRDDLAGIIKQALEPAHISVWTSEGR